MSAPPVDRGPTDQSPHRAEEVDLWWGSYAGRAMLPSFAVCAVLTVLILWGARSWVPARGWQQLTFFGLAGAVWAVQLTRWGRRFFTWNYRLTTSRLYVDRGVWPLKAQRFDLSTVARVEVNGSPLAKRLGIGDVWVWFDDATPPVVLEALVAPRRAAETIREAVRKTRCQRSDVSDQRPEITDHLSQQPGPAP
jgi:hypothetical protein